LERFEKLIPNVVSPDADDMNNHFDPLDVLRMNGLPFTNDQAELQLVHRQGAIVWRSGRPYRPVSREDLERLPSDQYYYLLKIGGQVLKGGVYRK
jgi:predicted  nucleic acid-binding Zn ribbon protein